MKPKKLFVEISKKVIIMIPKYGVGKSDETIWQIVKD